MLNRVKSLISKNKLSGKNVQYRQINYTLLVRTALWTGLLALVFWLVFMSVVPSGRIIYKQDFKGNNFHISKISPSDRIFLKDYNNLALPAIIGDPAYFSLKTPRSFDRAVIKLKYKRTGNLDLPLVEFGVLVDGTVWRYDLQPVENKILDQLALVWEKVEDDGQILLKRIGASSTLEYNDLDSFYQNPPEREKIAVYNTDIDMEYREKDYLPLSEKLKYDIPIRGNYQFFTYVGDDEEGRTENLYYKFTVLDLNMNNDPDPVDLHLYYNNDLIDSRHLSDDGISEDTGARSPEREIEFDLAGLPAGVYKIEMRANDDIVTNEIITGQKKFSFVNKVWIYDQSRKISLFTDSKNIKMQTSNPAALQNIALGDKEFEIKETYKQYNFPSIENMTEIKLNKANIILAGEGVFSFKSESLMNPGFKKVDSNLNISKDGIDYVLADYKIPAVKGEWREAVLEIDLSRAYRENGKYGFLISVPGLRAEDNDGKVGIMLRDIEIELEGRSLKEKLFNRK